MLDRLLQKLKNEAPRADAGDEGRLAAAVLLVEMARADFDHSPAEEAALRAILVETGVTGPAVDGLLDQARAKAKASISLYEFVKTLNASMTYDEKKALLGMLWKVAYADGRIDAHEEHLLRRITDLLHLSHADFIAGKLANEN